MITPGRYIVSFRTPIGEGLGSVEFFGDGTLSGGDSTFVYSGKWEVREKRFKATLVARREWPGPPGVFGMDEVDLTVTSDLNNPGRYVGFARQSPGIKLEVEITPV